MILSKFYKNYKKRKNIQKYDILELVKPVHAQKAIVLFLSSKMTLKELK